VTDGARRSPWLVARAWPGAVVLAMGGES
jgi:hypothetical protein